MRYQVTPDQVQKAAEAIVDFIDSSGLPKTLVMKSIMTTSAVKKTVKRAYDRDYNKNVLKFHKKIKQYFETLFLPALMSAIPSGFKKSEISKAGTPAQQATNIVNVIIRTAKLELVEKQGITIIKPGYIEAMISGGDAARKIAGIRVGFDVLSPEALKYAQQNAAKLITEITATARASIKLIIVEGIKAGASNQQIMNALRGTIGLNERWALAVSRYRTAQMELAEAKKISLLRAKKRARRYAEKLYRKRLLMIARTETAIAQSQGSLLSYKGIGVERVRFYAAHGACEICASMDGSIYTIHQAFGIIPVHPNCRCDWLSIAPKGGFKYPTYKAQIGEYHAN